MGFVWGDAHSWLLLSVGDQKFLDFSHMGALGVGGRGGGISSLDLEKNG